LSWHNLVSSGVAESSVKFGVFAICVSTKGGVIDFFYEGNFGKIMEKVVDFRRFLHFRVCFMTFQVTLFRNIAGKQMGFVF
jgi:hypothetical protein